MSWESFSFIPSLIPAFIKSNYMEIRMLLACCKEKKTFWNLKLNLDRIKETLKETEPEHFLHRIKNLYPRLRKYKNIVMPMITPSFHTRSEEYNSTWFKYHTDSLKRLVIDVEDSTFDLKTWNENVKHEATKRTAILAWYMIEDDWSNL